MSGRLTGADRPQVVVRFGDVQRVLSLFAEGIAGRFVHLAPVGDPSTGAGPRVTNNAVPDGPTIRLPGEIADFASARHNAGAYRVAVLHQLGSLEDGAVAFDLDRHSADRSDRPLFRQVFLTLEDLRIDRLVRRRYPGARADFERVSAHALRSRPPVPAGRPLASLLDALGRYSLGADREDLMAAHDPVIRRAMFDAAGRVVTAGASVHDSARAADDICALFGTLGRAGRGADATPIGSADAEHGENGDDGAGEPSDPRPTTDNPGGTPASDVDHVELTREDLTGAGVVLRGELSGDTGSGRGIGPADPSAQDAVTGSPVDPSHPPDPSDPSRPDVPGPDPVTRRARPVAPEGTRTFFYDEWDYVGQAYLPAWCRLFEHRLRGDDVAFIDEVRRNHAALSHQVRRRFASIRPRAWHRIHRTPDGDELSLDSVIEAVIDRRSGHATDETLYVRRDRARRDVAAAFLLDMSRSTDAPVPDPDEPPAPAVEAAESDTYARGYFDFDAIELTPTPPRRRVIDVAKESLAVMCDALQTLGDSHAIYGFSGSGRHNVEFHVAKEFTDRTTSRTWAALAAMEPVRYTRMGPAIRHSVAKLATRPERTKVLVVVTDGYPQDDGYGPDRNDRSYGIHDTAQAIREAAIAGITVFCITVDPAGHDHLREMCAEDRYLVIDDVHSLATELEKVYRTLTGS